MRVARVFPRRTVLTPTDDMAFVGYPPLELPIADEVHVSVAFSWDVPVARRLEEAWAQYYPKVLVGGPAIDGEGDGFTPGMYVKEGVTFTSRGCIRRCPWCIIRNPLRELPVRDGWIVQDNNLLATSALHLHRVFEMLQQQPKGIRFSGGLDARLLTPWIARELERISINQLFLAADSDGILPALERALGLLGFLPREKKRCYVLWGFNGESIEQGEERCRRVWELGGLPFVQLYQPIGGHAEYPDEIRRRARTWQRPAATKAYMNPSVKRSLQEALL